MFSPSKTWWGHIGVATTSRDTKKHCGKPGCPNDHRSQVLARGDGRSNESVMSPIGTFETCRRTLRTSVYGGKTGSRQRMVKVTRLTRFGRELRRGRFVQRAAAASNITPAALLCGDPWRTLRSPPLGEMVLNLSDWRRANRDHIRAPVPWLFVLAQAARRTHCWLRICRLPAGNPVYRALLFRRMTTPCHSGPRENEHTPRLHVCYTDRAGSGAWHAQRD